MKLVFSFTLISHFINIPASKLDWTYFRLILESDSVDTLIMKKQFYAQKPSFFRKYLSKQFLLFAVSSVALSFVLVSCSKEKDIDKISDAQTCLDTATASEVDACVAKVDGLSSQGASLIRCVGKFMKEGFTSPSKIAGAISNLNGGSGSNQSTAVMAALAFKAESTSALNSASAQQALTYCNEASSKGLILLAGLSQTATVLADLGLGSTTNLSGDALKTLMGTLQGNTVATTAVGTAVVSIYQTNCTSGNTTTGNFCQQFSSAVTSVSGGTSNPAAVGAKIMECYNTPTAEGCTGF